MTALDDAPARESVRWVDDDAAPQKHPQPGVAVWRQRLESSNAVRLAVLVTLLVTVGAATGLTASLMLPVEHAARAEVQYNLSESAAGGDLLREDRRLTTQLVTITSRVILEPVAAGTGMTPEKLASHVFTKVVDDSEVIEIEVRGASPAEAMRTLSLVVDRYVGVANTGWQDPVRLFVDLQLRDVQRQLKFPPTPGETAEMTQAVRAALTERQRYLLELQRQLESGMADAAQTSPPARLLVPPYAVDEPVATSPRFAALAGAAAGLVVATMVVLFIVRHRMGR
ncbi:MAG TPA: hypothetical protein VGA66_15160 [Mycobacterium sp.]